MKSLLAGFRFLLASPLVGGIALLGGLLTMASAVRVLYPALADNWQMSAAQIGFLYAAIPLGAAIGALTSGKLAHSARPWLLMLLSTLIVPRHWSVWPDADVDFRRGLSGAVRLAERG